MLELAQWIDGKCTKRLDYCRLVRFDGSGTPGFMTNITSNTFEAYLKCPTKCWLVAAGEPAPGNTYSKWTAIQNEHYRVAVTNHLLAGFETKDCIISPSPATLITTEWRLAVNVVIRALRWPNSAVAVSDLTSNFQAIERLPSKDRGNKAEFVPIRFTIFHKVDRDEKLMLAFDAMVLSELLGRDIRGGKIIHGYDHAKLKVKTSALAGEVRKRIMEIAALLASPDPPDLVLNRHCAACQFQTRCRQAAVERGDLSLLSPMSEKERKAFRNKGIFTVTQLSYTFRPRRRPKLFRGKRERYHHSLKALAIREKKVHVIGSPSLKIEGTPVYLDVEGLPDRDFYYLIGMRIGDGQAAIQHSLWAETIEDEGRIWNEFLDILATVEKPVLLHYGSYETTFLARMQTRYSGPSKNNVSTKTAIDQPRNLLSVIFAAVYFPTFSNSLKDIAGWLGFEWSEPEASGLLSIVWRHQWEESRSDEFKQKLITYNAEDCEALARLQNQLVEFSYADESAKPKESPNVVYAESLPNGSRNTFKRNQFQFVKFEQINQAAYWDYQRERVLVRSSKYLKKVAQTKLAKIKRKQLRANKIVNWPMPSVCPNCGGLKIYRHQTARKTVVDLRFGTANVKRWITTYRFNRCRCPRCGAVFHNSEGAWSGEKFGPNLQAFCVYQNIELRLSQLRVAAFVNLVFGIQLSRGRVNKFKESAAAFYQGTFETLLKSIVSGHLVHADETKVNLGGQVGYVWVFTNLEEAVYLYSPSREGELVRRVLKDFKGVLVSDFYAVYDSLNCAQQKCLIHLIRDLNNDLLKEPYNDEFKGLVGEVAVLLKPMIETIDRFGLKARFLRRHTVDVDQFFKSLSSRVYQTEAAQKCKQRLEKNRDKLFTFLDHDGVPWNNNNAEHAVKAFALLRKDFVGLSNEKGIKEYLVLLSICETCKFKGLNFLDFLRSGEKDVEAFANRSHKRQRS